MRKNRFIILLALFALAVSGGLYAANTFSAGVAGYYTYDDLTAGNYRTFLPGVRVEFFLNDFLGVSGDAVFKQDADYEDVYSATCIADVVLRLPLGPLEPYVATGPAFEGIIVGDYFDIEDSAFAYNLRGGVDLNLWDTFSVGTEVNFLVDDVISFVEGFSDLTPTQQSQVLKEYGTIGLTAKLKF